MTNPPLTSYTWKSPPPGFLTSQSTNFASHLLSYNNKALINQLLLSMLKNIQTSALCSDLTPFRPYVRAAVRIFFRIDPQSVNKCLLVHSGNMVVMVLLSLLHLSHSANEAERIIYILQLFHETSCSIKRTVRTQDAISCTQRLSNSLIRELWFWFQRNSTKESYDTSCIACTGLEI